MNRNVDDKQKCRSFLGYQEPKKLSLYEALVIIDKQPALNRQIDNFINPLKLFARSNHDHQTFVAGQTTIDISVDGNLNVNAARCRYFVFKKMKVHYVHFSL